VHCTNRGVRADCTSSRNQRAGCAPIHVASCQGGTPARIVRSGAPYGSIHLRRSNDIITILNGESMPAKSRVFWTTQEKHTVLTAAHKLRQQQPRSTLKQTDLLALRRIEKRFSNRGAGFAREERRRNACRCAAQAAGESRPGNAGRAAQRAAGVDRARRSNFERHPKPSERAERVGKWVEAELRFAQALMPAGCRLTVC